MFSVNLYFYFVLCLMLALGVNAAFKVPSAHIEALSPKGFRVSIPHREGMKLVAFHGNLNKKIGRREGGEFSVDIGEPSGGTWTYTNRDQKLNNGDKINYWVYVDYFDGERTLGYHKEKQSFIVR